MRKSAPRRAGGFTLIELLVVVLIVGVLAAIAVPQYFAVIEKGHFSESTLCIDTIKSAEQRYALSTGGYAPGTDLTVPPNTTPASNPLDVGCTSLKYFGATVSISYSGPGSPAGNAYVVILTRNGSSFSTTSGAPTNYTVELWHLDGQADSWRGNAPASWLPE